MSSAGAPQRNPKRRSAAAILGVTVCVIACALGLWRYADFLLISPLRGVFKGGSSIYLLRDFGGPFNGNDFRHLYTGAWMIWRGLNPYDPELLLSYGEMLTRGGLNPYVYLPFTGQVMGPLAALSYPNAFLAWFLLNHAMAWLAIGAAFLGLRMRCGWRSAAFAILIVALSFPFYRTLSAGQLNMVLALGYALFWLALERRRERLAGFVAAFAMLFKLSPGILAVYLAWTRRWRALAWMGVWTAVLLAGSVAMSGPRRDMDFLPILRDMGYGRSTWARFGQHFYCDEANQSFNALFHHLFAQNPADPAPLIDLGARAANGLTWLASAGLLAAVLALTRPRRREGEAATDPLAYSLFVFLSLFLPSLCWDHYFIQLLFPILAMFQALERKRSWAIGVLFAVSLLAVWLPFDFWSPRWKSGAGLAMMSWKLWGALGLFAANALLLVRERRAAMANEERR